MVTYAINWSNGGRTYCDTYIEAQEVVRDLYPSAEIGHDGDLDGFGDRTLCWESAEDAQDDDGARAVCSIRCVNAG